jgi:hypothetical protein
MRPAVAASCRCSRSACRPVHRSPCSWSAPDVRAQPAAPLSEDPQFVWTVIASMPWERHIALNLPRRRVGASR